MTDHTLKDILTAVDSAGTLLLTTHIQPDGDAIGSLLTLYEFVVSRGKKARMVLQDPVPENLRFLPYADCILPVSGLDGPADDLAISVDASDVDRLGEAAAPFFKAGQTVQMDHHRTNTRFAATNVVREEASSSGVVIYELLKLAGTDITQTMATNLYTAVSTDTGNFCFGYLNDELFEQMAVLMRAGLPIVETARRLHLMHSREQVLLLGRALRSLTFLEDGQLTMMQLTADDFKDCNATGEHTERTVNYALNIPGVQMCFLASELPEGIKFSLRCLAPYDVSQVASFFGGGGHALAAGCTLQGTLEDSVDRMRRALTGLLNGQWRL